jgi:squalene monooxygenase
MRESYDVVVIGAGPVGCVAAAAAARTGAQVLLLEQNPDAAKRFAGEWLHPVGVAVLDRLRLGRLEAAQPRTGYGFVVFPDDGSSPIELAYPEGQVALSAEHARMVSSLRAQVEQLPEVAYRPHARVLDVDGHSVTFRGEQGDVTVHAGRVVACDGRASMARKALGLAPAASTVSYMAGVELRGVELPAEGYGHVVLGGPGPVLLYRISADVVRACFDVPVEFDASRRSPAFLWDAFSAILPGKLAPALRAALERGPVQWAVNRFAPRTAYGTPPVWLAGDAVGHFHPLTAAGMTLGFLDAERAGQGASFVAYREEREEASYVPELLSNALYQVFTRDDPSAAQIRSAVYGVWRKSRFERERTMRILMGAEPGRAAFGAAFARMAVAALGSTVRDLATGGRLKELAHALGNYREWAQWPAASLAPSRGRQVFRERSNALSPIPLHDVGLFPVRAEPSSAARVPVIDMPALADDAMPVQEALARSGNALLTELRRLHERIGRDPDWALLRRATRIVAAIDAAELGAGMSARMRLARRPMARLGMTRLLDALAAGGQNIRASDFASFVLAVLSARDDDTIDRLEEGVRHLVACQRADGGFAAFTTLAPSDFETTGLVCRALAACLSRHGDVHQLGPVLERARRFWLEQQCENGSWPASQRDGALSNTAHAMCALAALGEKPSSPVLRRAARFLCHLQEERGTFGERADEAAGTAELTARAVRALLTVPGPHWGAIQRAVPHLATDLAEAVSSELNEGHSESAWERCCDVTEALAAFDAQRRARPHSELEGGDDWAFCKHSLEAVSRTFSKPIAMLPAPLEAAVTCGYLLCRVADTVEDHPAVPRADKDRLFALFLDVLERGAPPRGFALAFEEIPGDDAELELARKLPRVMHVFWGLPAGTQAVVARWVAEMARGMSLYTHREPGEDGFVALYTVEDLERYCYYVAGTVGHMLTELFAEFMGERVSQATLDELGRHAESFGAGLQLVNILKDVTDDRERRWSFVPRAACARVGVRIDNLCEPALRGLAHEAVAPLFDLARQKLDHALAYALAIPAEQKGVRLFCLLPLWMAALTLLHGRGNDAMFEAGAEVKISRRQVEQVIADCLAHAGDDAALRARYASLWLSAGERYEEKQA